MLRSEGDAVGTRLRCCRCRERLRVASKNHAGSACLWAAHILISASLGKRSSTRRKQCSSYRGATRVQQRSRRSSYLCLLYTWKEGKGAAPARNALTRLRQTECQPCLESAATRSCSCPPLRPWPAVASRRLELAAQVAHASPRPARGAASQTRQTSAARCPCRSCAKARERATPRWQSPRSSSLQIRRPGAPWRTVSP